MNETNTQQQIELPSYNLDLNYRPATYWSEAKAARANVTGTLRRAALEEALHSKDSRAARAALDDKRGAENREILGALHPSFRSGEDLRPVSRGEVEIARITLDSVHGEVTSIRARLRNGRILYRIDDECANEFGLKVTMSPLSSKLPLSLSQLITSINAAHSECYGSPGLVIPHWHTVLGREYDVASAASFVRIQSYFYPHSRPMVRCAPQALRRTAEGSQSREGGRPVNDSKENNKSSAESKTAWDSALEALGIKRIKDPGWQALSMLIPGDDRHTEED